MNCEACQDFIDAYADNELDAAATISVERHLRDCTKCRQRLEGRNGLRALLHQPQLRFEAPGSLRAKVRSALRAASAEAPPRWHRRFLIPWFSVPLALATLVVVLGPAFFPAGGRRDRSPDRTLVGQVISNHVRSLLAAHLLDVPSTDQHTVKPWFAGKLEFSPPVQDFAERGFSLIGGRLDYLNGQTVAALVYRHKQHVINVFIWSSQTGRIAPARGLSAETNVQHASPG